MNEGFAFIMTSSINDMFDAIHPRLICIIAGEQYSHARLLYDRLISGIRMGWVNRYKCVSEEHDRQYGSIGFQIIMGHNSDVAMRTDIGFSDGVLDFSRCDSQQFIRVEFSSDKECMSIAMGM